MHPCGQSWSGVAAQGYEGFEVSSAPESPRQAGDFVELCFVFKLGVKSRGQNPESPIDALMADDATPTARECQPLCPRRPSFRTQKLYLSMDQNAQTQESPELLVKVDDLWFTTDTIVVIRAENKIFRVSGGILAARSTVFRDMIAFPQPNIADIEQMDGSPVVRLHDSAEDVEVFLRAIYDSSYFMPAPAPNDLSVVLGILRLSHKYDVQYLHLRALEHLAADGWYCETFDKDMAWHLRNGTPPFAPIYSLQVILAAIEVGALWFLPNAYFSLATYSSRELLPLLEGNMAPHVAKALAAHTDIVRAHVAIHRFLISSDLCSTPEICNAARISALSDVLDDVSEPDLNPLHKDFEAVAMNGLRSFGMCGECRESARVRLREAASGFWDELPSIFGQPPWEELRAMKRATTGEVEDKDIAGSDSN